MKPDSIARGALTAALLLGTLAFPAAGQAQPAGPAPVAAESAYDRLFQQAAQARLRNRPDLAMEAVRKILESQPDNADALYQLGELQLQTQAFDQVRATIATLRRLDPADPRAMELEHTLAFGPPDEALLAEARRLVEARLYDQAIAVYRQAFGGDRPPRAFGLEYYETLAATAAGAAEARRQLKALADSRGTSPQARLAYARVLTYADDTRREGIALLAPLTGDPSVGQAAQRALREALLWLSAGPADKALYESYLQRFGGDDAIRQKLAVALQPPKIDPSQQAVSEAYKLLEAGSTEAATRQLEALVKAEPANADALAALGIARLRAERFADARELLTRAIALAPARRAEWAQALDTAEFWADYREAIALRDRKELAAAEKLARSLAAHAGANQVAAQTLLADLLRRQGRTREAEALYREALQRDPADKEALAGLFELLSAQGRDPAAEPLLARVDATTREQLRSRRTLESAEQLRASARAVEKTDPAKAEALFRQALQADPSNPWIAYDLATLLTRVGRGAEAQPLIDGLAASGRAESLYAAAVYLSEQKRPREAMALLERIPAGQRNPRITALIGQIGGSEDMDRLVAAARAGDAAARSSLLAQAASATTPRQSADAALALARIGESQQAMVIVRRVSARPDLPADVTRTLFYAALEAGADADANVLLGRLGTAGGDTANLREAMAIRQSDRLREQKQLAAAFDVLAPYVGGRTPSVALRLALARVYRDSRFVNEAMQVLDGIAASPTAGADALAEAATIATDLGKYDRAAAWIDGALKQQSGNPRLYLIQAKLLRERGDNAGAQRALETARQLNSRQSALPGRPTPVGPRASRSQVASLEGVVSGVEAVPRRDDSFVIRLAQADGSAPVPLRRPGGASVSVATSDQGSKPAGSDSLGREIEKEIAALDQKTSTTIEGGIGYRFRTGDAGLGKLNEVTTPLKARIPLGAGALNARVTPTMLNAGTMSLDQASLDRFGSNAAQAAGTGNAPTVASAGGVGLGIGFDWSNFNVEIGTSPLGFPLPTLLGTIGFQAVLSDTVNLKLSASRASVTESVLSYAGMTDPRTGMTWGGVTRNGGEAVLSYDDGKFGAYGKLAYAAYLGSNVQSNNGLEVSVGAYYRPIKDEHRELRIGLAATYLSFQQNVNGYTIGQGGYFSPQNFYIVGTPVDWSEQSGRLKYNVGGTIGIQGIQTDSSPYFPTNSDLQAAAVNNASTDPSRSAYNPGSSVTKLAFAARFGLEYAVTDRVSIGGRAEIDNAQNFTQGTMMLFLRSALN